MSHQIGNAVTTQDFLSKLTAFATALGWTVAASDLGYVLAGTGGNNKGRVTLCNPAGDAYWEFVGYDSTSGGLCSLAIIPSTGYNPAANLSAQPGNFYGTPLAGVGGPSMELNYMAYPFTSYQMFGTNQYLHVVVEHQPGKFRHFHIGTLNKRSAFTGGQYCAVTHLDTENSNYWNSPFTSYNGAMPWDCRNNGYQYGVYSATVVRVDVDGFAPGWHVATDNGNNPRRLLCEYSGDDDLALMLGVSPNVYNQLSCGIPFLVDVLRQGTTVTYSPLGEPSDVRVMRYGNYAPAQIQTIGADQWVMFPALGVPNPGATESDTGIGYMYRIVP